MKSKNKFKAYISYSHKNARWAAWLHKALESYRVPRKLVGIRNDVGKVPARIMPVFRDRDDLSSTSDLGGTVKQALIDSENMIVICSPDAVASHWVNEEIRQFASLGRQKQIFCVIVDGEPGGVETLSTCFPAALAEIGLQEPLAADVRKWADGKLLSKLKLVAGMLGLPLDQLRRRDLQKRQKIWSLAAVASVVMVTVLIMAVTARIAAQQRRDSGESLVAYKLNELRTVLNVTQDPEDLSRLDQWSGQELGKLIAYAGVGKNVLIQSALELRNQGDDLYQKGALGVALERYEQSWALVAESYRRDRSNQATFFELGQAEFYIGQIHMDKGELDKAEEAFTAYAEITRRLILLQPENADWVLEMAYALNNLGSLQNERDTDNPERTLQLMQSALEYNQIALVLDPKNDYYQSELGQSHAFLADAQRGVCDLEGALLSRQKNVSLERDSLSKDVKNINKVMRLAWAISGYSVVLEETGRIEEAIQSLDKVLEMMVPVLSANPDSKQRARYILHRKHRLLMLEAMNGDVEQAWLLMNALNDDWQRFFMDGGIEDSAVASYVTFALDRAWLAQFIGKTEMADRLLQETTTQVLEVLGELPGNRAAENLLLLAAFQSWETNQEPPSDLILKQLPDFDLNGGRTRSCLGASYAVRQALIDGKRERAVELTEYLFEKGFRGPRFMRICEAYALCT